MSSKSDTHTTEQIKAETRLEGNNKRVFYIDRKVAIMEEIHLQNSGKSLQQQMSRVQDMLKRNVEKVGNLEERGATKGDIDALARQKCDTSEVNLMSQRIEARIREGLKKKYDTDVALKALKKKVNLADLKERVKSFVTPVVYTIISEKLPEAVEETKNGLVQLVKRMFDVDPDQRADMENVNRLIKQNEEIMANAKVQAEKHANEIAILQSQVAEAIAEVRATAADKLKEQTDMMKKEMNGMLTTMTETAKNIQEDTIKRVTSAVDDLKAQNQKVLDATKAQITEKYDTFVTKATDTHEKFKVELDLKYQKDIGSMTARVERCVEQVNEMTGFFKTIKGRMKELQSAQQQVTVKVDSMETFIGSLESKFDVISADTQDLRNDDLEIRKNVGALEESSKQMSRALEATKLSLTELQSHSDEARNALSQRIDALKNKQKNGGNKALAKFKNLDSKMKNRERQINMQMVNQEKVLLDQVRIASQHEANDLRDVKAAIDRRFVEMTSDLRSKEREIGSLRKQCLGYERQIKRLDLKIQEGEDKSLTIEKKVKKMHASNILQKVLGMMQPKGKKETAMGNKLLEMAALKKANAQLADVQSVSSGWQNEVGDANNGNDSIDFTSGKNKNDGTNGKILSTENAEIKSRISAVDATLENLRENYVNLKIQVDDEMMLERKRHEAHLTQMKEDLKARHEEELEIQRQDWQERTDAMRDQYESQIGRIHDTHSKIQDQLHEAHAVTAVLQAHKLQAEEMVSKNASDSMAILSDDTLSSTKAFEEHARQVTKTHEQFHLEIVQIKQIHNESREEMHSKLLETKQHVIEMAKHAVLEHADKHIKEMLSNFQDTSQNNGSPKFINSIETGEDIKGQSSESVPEQINVTSSNRGVDSDRQINLSNVIMTSQKHQDHRIDVLLKKQMVAAREIGLLRSALLELEAVVVKFSKTNIENNRSPNQYKGNKKSNLESRNASPTSQIEDAVQKARSALIGVATEANEAMKRVVAQTSSVESYIRKHENEERRLRAEQEYRHLKDIQQMQRLNKAHKMKSLIEEQKNSNNYQKSVDKLEQENRQLKAELNQTKSNLLAELKQTRAEKQTFEMMAQRLSEKQTKQRMQQPQTDSARKQYPIGNFIGKGGSLRRYDEIGEDLRDAESVREVDILEYVPKRIGNDNITLNQSLEIIGARTPNVPYTASEGQSAAGAISTVGLSGSTVDHGFDRQPNLEPPESAQSIRSIRSVKSEGSLWSDRPPSHQKYSNDKQKENGVGDENLVNSVLTQVNERLVEVNTSNRSLISDVHDKLGEVDFGVKNNRSL